jgi:ATP-dependent Clp protease protease subunit
MTLLVDGDLVLYGFVGDDFWGEGFTASGVIDALAELGRDADITVRINSGGGYTDDGIAIYNALAQHKGKVAVVVDAVALSSASVIAMAGDTITMRAGALMMIHDPAGLTWGDAAAHEKSKTQLDKLGELMAGIYADRTGGDAMAIREDMRAELWLTGAEAVERGFATETEAGKAKATAAFDYRLYAHAPEKLVALAKRERWSLKTEAARKAAAAATPEKHGTEEPTMTDKTKAAATTAEAPKDTGIPISTPPQAVDEAAIVARIEAITESEEGKANPTLAKHFAFKTKLGADEAVAALQAAAADAAPQDEAPNPAQYQADRSAAQALAQPVAKAGAKPKGRPTASSIYAARKVAVTAAGNAAKQEA